MVRQPDAEIGPPHKKRRFRNLMLLVGLVVVGIGVWLVLQSFTSDGTKLHSGVVIGLLGIVMASMAGLMRDKLDHKYKPQHRRTRKRR